MLKFLLNSTFRAIVASYDTPERKGARGERRVHNALTFGLRENDYRVLSDLILPAARGTTQIDHLILSRFGIFVIETKNMSGWIFGETNQEKWTQVQNRRKRSFQNPLRQNYAHVKAVQEILQVDENALHNLVVFTGSAEPKTVMPDSVAWGLKDLGRLIALQNEQVFSDAQVNAYAQKLRDQSFENTKAVRQEHVENLRKKSTAKAHVANAALASDTATTTCPRCGSKMVKRTNRKTGDVFLGCANFPRCKGTRKAT
ncbi:NERD domain-containing protein [Actibacterium sp.]|uniref:NERD domain-containing protein n=1 Tax=Actibacterium sp. TaxID=1872125 RepID=UPI00356A7690